jgi:hypothetical protein
MKMNSQTRTFARQVQVDLLGLTDADLFQTVHFWVNTVPGGSITEETRSALGYTHNGDDLHTRSLNTFSEIAIDEEIQWLAPAPQQLRERLTDMNLQLFVQLVLPLAFQSLHMEHPEWGEGATFNAHLANHLRSINMKR